MFKVHRGRVRLSSRTICKANFSTDVYVRERERGAIAIDKEDGEKKDGRWRHVVYLRVNSARSIHVYIW